MWAAVQTVERVMFVLEQVIPCLPPAVVAEYVAASAAVRPQQALCALASQVRLRCPAASRPPSPITQRSRSGNLSRRGHDRATEVAEELYIALLGAYYGTVNAVVAIVEVLLVGDPAGGDKGPASERASRQRGASRAGLVAFQQLVLPYAAKALEQYVPPTASVCACMGCTRAADLTRVCESMLCAAPDCWHSTPLAVSMATILTPLGDHCVRYCCPWWPLLGMTHLSK